MNGVYFISGIDTDAGKSVATGFIAKTLLAQEIRVITHKLIQTGCTDVAADILIHRQIMGCGLLDVDDIKLTMPQLFPYPCSPHLASRLAGRTLDLAAIEASIASLTAQYQVLLIEGAGGLMVPLNDDLLCIDYIKAQQWPVILVTSGKLGSINHTLLSLEALRNRNIPVYAIAYNQFFDSSDAIINRDTHHYLQRWLRQSFPNTRWIDIPVLSPLQASPTCLSAYRTL